MSFTPRIAPTLLTALSIVASATLFTACDSDDVEPGEVAQLEYEGELITVEDPELEPTDQPCAEEDYSKAAACLDGTSVAFCDFEFNVESTELDFSFGACMDGAAVECEPLVDTREVEDWCGTLTAACMLGENGPEWSTPVCETEGEDTPIVLRFDAAPITMIAAEATPMATFDISMRADQGSCINTDWPSADTPWLAIDLDHSGSIDGGHELFGSGSDLAPGVKARNGFLALAAYDQNRDGVVDSKDPRFGELVLWRDFDADRLSTPGELEPLADAGVRSLTVDYVNERECDERGNCAIERSTFAHAGGQGELVDLHLSCH